MEARKRCHVDGKPCSEGNVKLIITGLNRDTLMPMRPSTWNHMLAGRAAEVSEKGIQRCAHCLVPGVTPDGVATLEVGMSLGYCDPFAMEHVLKFAAQNRLIIRAKEAS